MHFQATRIKSLQKIFFNVLKSFDAFPDHHNQVLKKDIFQRLECLKTCFDAFPDQQNQVLHKDTFQRLEWVKTCFDAFPDHQNQVLKKDLKRVLMHFQATRIKSF
jgi:hypothetical protein